MGRGVSEGSRSRIPELKSMKSRGTEFKEFENPTSRNSKKEFLDPKRINPELKNTLSRRPEKGHAPLKHDKFLHVKNLDCLIEGGSNFSNVFLWGDQIKIVKYYYRGVVKKLFMLDFKMTSPLAPR